MLNTDQINDLHRLYWSEHWSIRRIERHLKMCWKTIRKYLDAPAQGPARRNRFSKLDPFKSNIAEWLEKDPQVTAAVIEQRLRPLGYTGGPSILQDHVRKVRPQLASRRAFVRMEPLAGERFEVDWGHFGALNYSGDRKTFLARVFGWKACQANQRVLFSTAMDTLNHLLASQVDHSLVRKLKAYTEPTLLIVDELGYLSLDQQTSNLFYQVISTRHSQKRSTIITTNTPFSDWGNILFNTTIATAIADRLVENSEIFLLGGESLRKANKTSDPSAE